MSIEPVKVIISVSGGAVTGIYAGNRAQQMIQVIIVDHDNCAIGGLSVDPLNSFSPGDCESYAGEIPEGWV